MTNENKNVLEMEIGEISDRMSYLAFAFEQNMEDEELKNAVDGVLETNELLADLVARRDMNVLQTLYVSMYSSVMIMKMFTGAMESEEMMEAKKEVQEYMKNYEG